MKKYFLYTVAISALCISCETTDEAFINETDNYIANKVAKINQEDELLIYNDIIANYSTDTTLTYAQNLMLFEQYVNAVLPQYLPQSGQYVNIDIGYVNILNQTGDKYNFIQQLNFSQSFNQALTKLVKESTAPIPDLQDENENRLIAVLSAMQQQGQGNGDEDDKWKRNNRTIAFAYGAQYGFKQAVLYAGSVELKID